MAANNNNINIENKKDPNQEETKKPLGESLAEKGLIGEEDLKKALVLQKKSKARLGQILIKQGYVSEENILYHLATQYKLEYVEKLEVKNIELLTSRTPIKFVQRYRIVPYDLEGNVIKVALSNPEQLHPLDELRMLWLGYDIITVLTPEPEILRLINRFYESGDKDKEATEGEDFDLLDEIEDLQDSLNLANEAPIIKMVNVILSNAVNEKASDIHVEPQEKELWVRYRVDGMLRKVLQPVKSIQSGIISRIKIMANMNIAESRLPQDGRIKIRVGGKEVDIRVSSLPSQFGERIVMRILNKTDTKYELENIGMGNANYIEYKNLLKNPNGILLITGPTGSGKTSTLYASLNLLNQESRNIITVEDPVEYQISGISQVQAKHEIGLTFAEGLRSILRQDPDVIMVGEIRDEETARVAIQSSLTGHLVFSTLHTNDAPSAVTRLMDMGIEPYLITSTCLGFMAQRLVRILCHDCKKKTTMSSSELTELGYTKSFKGKKNITVYKAQGCKQCFDIGYRGRTGIYELLILNNDLRNIILDHVSLDKLREESRKMGMVVLRESGLQKVLEGITSIDEVIRVT